MYQALYRKWRPKTFSQVVGQDHITGTLQRQVAEGRTAHAYLFTGTRGTGKTTCARILAKAVNCLHPEDGAPCNQCEACRGIDSGSLLDVTELDAASNSRVDDIRELLSESVYTPTVLKKRVYIIDEVHMLSTFTSSRDSKFISICCPSQISSAVRLNKSITSLRCSDELAAIY